MTLGTLLSGAAGRGPIAAGAVAAGDAARTVASVTSDSRDVVPGSLFVALKGLKADGTAFARDAIPRGAIAVVAEVESPAEPDHGQRQQRRDHQRDEHPRDQVARREPAPEEHPDDREPAGRQQPDLHRAQQPRRPPVHRCPPSTAPM